MAGEFNFSFLQNPQIIDAMAQSLAQSGAPAPGSVLGAGLAGNAPVAGGAIDPKMLALQAVGAALPGQKMAPIEAHSPYVAGLGNQPKLNSPFGNIPPAAAVQLPPSLR